jgi:thiol-disulfide isomerase/thioredoxin
MNIHRRAYSQLLLTAVLVAACGGGVTDEAMLDKTTPASMTEEAAISEESMPKETPGEEAMVENPAWFGAALTDVRTGQTFSIQDFKGRVILVEAMAVWCSKCLQQQKEVQALRARLGNRDDFVAIGLDIDPNEDSEKLKTFTESQGFDWRYAVSPADVSRELASLYGANFLNPPSTPILVVDRHGNTHLLPFGIKSADELLQFIQPLLDEAT